MNIAIITGSAGLIGSQACQFFSDKGFKIIGIDNDMRSYFFGESASTKKSLESIEHKINDYKHYNIDIRNYDDLRNVFSEHTTDIKIVIHTAAQPSHDWAAKEPLTDFTVNALGTMNLLELTRIFCPDATFIFTSTNKVYGDRPNYLDLVETNTRWEINHETFKIYPFIGNDASINEFMSIDNTKHSVFGASKVAADIMCQEYGKYFGLNVGIFRGGCLTGPNHAGAELHGFLSYLVKCIVNNKPYTIFGYGGKQVRDNIHSWDLVNMFWHFHQNPKKGEVYNAGGGRENSISILEAIDQINEIAGTNWNNYTISEQNRIGDHIWYITDLSKFKSDYPEWNITIDLRETLRQIIEFEKNKNKNVLKVSHNAGFFSCCSMRINGIIRFFKENSFYPVVDSSELWAYYKETDGDISKRFFKDNNIDIETDIMDDVPEQFSEYSVLDFKNLNPIIEKYYKPSDEVIEMSNHLVDKYGLDLNNIIAVCFRGNDKHKETNLPDYNDIIEKLTEVKNKYPNHRILIQSDEIEFYQEVFKYHSNFIYFEEVAKMNKNNTLALQYVIPMDQRVNQAQIFLAISLIISKCHKIIINSGNVGMFITLFRGNANGIYQYLNHKEYIYGYYNPHHATQTKFWYDND